MRRNYFGLVLGVILAVVAVVLLNYYIRNIGQAPRVPMTNVVVAGQDLPFGTKLSARFLRTVAWPQASVPAGAFSDIADIFKGAQSPSDRIVLTALVQGEPVLHSKISGFGARPIMSARVDKDMRAVSIHIDPVSGVSGFILPGDHVDILLTRNLGGGQQNYVTDVILQDVTVLGINQLADQSADKPVVGQTATVEVTPQQAQKLALAQQAGTLSLSLRNMDTLDKVAALRVNESELTNPRPAAHHVAPRPVVRVRYGDGSVVNHPISALN
ncbi:MAG: Flp pilus assembly protein CpaB [Alphaproteobacteria bacterium 64-11]|nr:Flp pilus assembly protein CpaB [Alphaproteobacteria bacterium]OJU10400.1 MAG: Flp pilus assembly protein CpaB [Alphaproteobacteria bacterium 64-11]